MSFILLQNIWNFNHECHCLILCYLYPLDDNLMIMSLPALVLRMLPSIFFVVAFHTSESAYYVSDIELFSSGQLIGVLSFCRRDALQAHIRKIIVFWEPANSCVENKFVGYSVTWLQSISYFCKRS